MEEKKFMGLDGLDIVIAIIAAVSLVGLMFVNTDAATRATITQVLWAALVGLGLKKVPVS